MSDLDELKEYEKRAEEKAQEFARKIVDKIPIFVAIGITIWWTLYGSVDVGFDFKVNVVERIAYVLIQTAFAISYCALIADGGFTSAYRTEKYRLVNDEWKKAIIRGNNRKEEINKYAYEIAKRNLHEVRRESLATIGLKYEQVFDEDGLLIMENYAKDKSLTHSQKRIIRRCAKLKIIKPKLFGSISGKFFGLEKEESRSVYETRTNITKGLFRIVLSVFTFGISFVFKGFNANGIIYAVFQIVLWSSSAIMQRMKNFNFVLDKELPQIETKTLIINGYLDTHKEEAISNGN